MREAKQQHVLCLPTDKRCVNSEYIPHDWGCWQEQFSFKRLQQELCTYENVIFVNRNQNEKKSKSKRGENNDIDVFSARIWAILVN